MIGGIIMVFVALWIYQSAMKAKMTNVMMWVAGACVIFWVAQFALIGLNVSIFDLDGTKTESQAMLSSADKACADTDGQKASAKADGDMGQFKNSSCSNVHGGDRQDKDRFQGFSGAVKSLYFDLFPSLLSFLAIAFLRIKLITKESLSVGNLFSGIKEMFQSIKQSFKTAE